MSRNAPDARGRVLEAVSRFVRARQPVRAFRIRGPRGQLEQRIIVQRFDARLSRQIDEQLAIEEAAGRSS